MCVCDNDHSPSRRFHVSWLVVRSHILCVCVYVHAHVFVITIDLGWKSISVVNTVFSQITLYVNTCSLELIS